MPPAPFTDRTLGFLVADIARLLRRSMDRRLQSLGLTQAQWRAIVHLSRREGMTQAALAESLEVQPITLTRLIDRMQHAGWVERRPHPSDRRGRVVVLTDAARAAFFTVFGERLRAMREVAMRYDGHELDVIARFLDDLGEAMDPAAT